MSELPVSNLQWSSGELQRFIADKVEKHDIGDGFVYVKLSDVTGTIKQFFDVIEFVQSQGKAK